MTFDNVEYSINSKTAEGRIKLNFMDIDHSLPQFDNQISRSVTFTLQEWQDVLQKVKQVVGIDNDLGI